MVKFVATTPEGTLVGLGLSYENLDRLREGQPIPIKLEAMLPGVAIEVLLFAGSTEAVLAAQLAELIGPETQVRPLPPSHP